MPHLPIARAASLTTTILLTALPHGGQRTARRNAWASMSTDAARAPRRREAGAALAKSAFQAQVPGGQQAAHAR